MKTPAERQEMARAAVLTLAKSHQDSMTEIISLAGEGYIEIGKKKDEAKQFTKSMVEQAVGIVPVSMFIKSVPAGMGVGIAYEFATKNIIESAFKIDAQKKATKKLEEFSDSAIELQQQHAEQAFTGIAPWTGSQSPEAWAKHPDNRRREREGYSYEKEKFFDSHGNIMPIVEMSPQQYAAYSFWREDSDIGAGLACHDFFNALNTRDAQGDAKSEDPVE